MGERLIAGGLDQPREMNHDIGTLEDAEEVVLGDIRLLPSGLGKTRSRDTPGHSADLLHRSVPSEGGQDTRPDIPGSPRHHDARHLPFFL